MNACFYHFSSVTSANLIDHVVHGYSEKVAHQALKASDWHLDGALDIFYSHPQIRGVIDSRRLEELYQRYKGKYCMLVDCFSRRLCFIRCC